MRIFNFSPFETPMSQLSHAPSASALSGDVGRGLGALPNRQRQAPTHRTISPASIHYVWPNRHHPLPRRPDTAT